MENGQTRHQIVGELLAAEKVRVTVVHIAKLQILAEKCLVFFDFGYVWVVREERDGGAALCPKPGAVVRTQAGDGPDWGARVLRIKESWCVSQTTFAHNAYLAEQLLDEPSTGGISRLIKMTHHVQPNSLYMTQNSSSLGGR
ncbi:hypothetical protein EYF80_037331 [Liparis tanakae]|uniref:Uncharacterized protein n=1 Tax=Liparis tanakae TaxID=230148 RepID=A0A4Z2GIF3_9TELE|nr:hypothetical protein EYF80_037331 [Liparis tanakae]